MIQFFRDVYKYRRYLLYSARAELKEEVSGSFLSGLWWLLDPLLFMIVYTFVYSVVFGKNQDYLCAFIFIGHSTWMFFNRCILASGKLIRKNRPVLAKIYLPKFILVLTTMLVNGFKLLISLGYVAITMVIYRVPLTFQILWLIPYLALLFVMTFGCCCLLMHCGVFVNDLNNIVNVLLRLMFYLSGIFYNPERQLSGIIKYLMIRLNPTCYIITQLRNSMLYGQVPLVTWYLVWMAASVLVAWFGIVTIYKYERRYVKTV